MMPLSHTKAFTLIESLVAVSILLVATAAPLYGANRAIVASGIARDRLTASYLAQEGMEYVRAMRDAEYLAVYTQSNPSGRAWYNFLNGNISGNTDTASVYQCTAPNLCTLDPTVNGIAWPVAQCTSSCGPLYLLANGTYSQTGSANQVTKFTRTIQVQGAGGSSTEELVTSRVTWSYRGTTYSVTIQDHLTPWQ